MSIRYYLTLFPMEALVASELSPKEFGSYMATGSKKGTSEKLIFVEILEEFGTYFDWEYAHKKCVSHPNGEPKHSLYLSVYRVAENVPLDKIGNLYLTTKDGSVLALKKEVFVIPEKEKRNYTLYQELCPIRPLVVSKLSPDKFAQYIISGDNKITAPTLFFTDLKIIDFDDLDNTGNIGCFYDKNIEHLKVCIDSVKNNPNKVMKTLDRSHGAEFSYQLINRGIYAADQNNLIIFKMPAINDLEEKHYDWAKSALII
ncbi:MAG: hypothetical protein BKP49_00860 [Treponema sp. CETP13]|nr:MAG: hypothetical protein BKP49_00860 [Treponema sp. CETP13]